jgi:proteic killer suppression protein
VGLAISWKYEFQLFSATLLLQRYTINVYTLLRHASTRSLRQRANVAWCQRSQSSERPVEVLFTDAKIERAFSDQRELRRRWGAVGGKKITLRLQQLAAAPTMAEMRSLPGWCHALIGDRAGCFAVDVHQPYRLIFRPTSASATSEEPKGWTVIDSVTIIDVIDYH